MRNLGYLIRKLREKKLETLRELATILDVSADCLFKIERGKIAPPITLVQRLNNHFGVDVLVVHSILFGDIELLPRNVKRVMKRARMAWKKELNLREDVMDMIHALSIPTIELKLALDSMSDEELTTLLKQLQEQPRYSDEYQSVLALVGTKYKKRRLHL